MYGREFAEIYDHIYELRGRDHLGEAKGVADAVRARMPGAASLLEVGCGTGGLLIHFRDLFDEAEGLDLTEAMLDVAADRMPGTPLHLGDMRAFDLGRSYDAIACMYATLSHQEDTGELAATLRCFARHLNPGGVVVIDPWWFPETFTDNYTTAQALDAGDRLIARASYARRDGDVSLTEVHYVVTSRTGIRHFTETYTHRLFPREVYESAIRGAGFAVEYVEGVQAAPNAGRGLFLGTLEEAA